MMTLHMIPQAACAGIRWVIDALKMEYLEVSGTDTREMIKFCDKENLHIQELGQSRLQQEPPYLVPDSTGS